MTSLQIPGMSCGHCTAAIDKAVKAVDPAATIAFDLETRRVNVDSALGEPAIAAAIRDAGYEIATTSPI